MASPGERVHVVQCPDNLLAGPLSCDGVNGNHTIDAVEVDNLTGVKTLVHRRRDVVSCEANWRREVRTLHNVLIPAGCKGVLNRSEGFGSQVCLNHAQETRFSAPS